MAFTCSLGLSSAALVDCGEEADVLIAPFTGPRVCVWVCVYLALWAPSALWLWENIDGSGLSCSFNVAVAHVSVHATLCCSQELMSRTSLETQKLDLIDEVSFLKLKLVSMEETHSSSQPKEAVDTDQQKAEVWTGSCTHSIFPVLKVRRILSHLHFFSPPYYAHFHMPVFISFTCCWFQCSERANEILI